MRSAGIIPVFAAGNTGPVASSSVSPANYPESLAVGVTDTTDVIDPMSANGPASCGEPTATYPDLVAPGVNVLSTDLFGTYSYWIGTSMAAPSVSGALAVLLGTPAATTTDVQAAVLATAVDLGPLGPDNVYGRGRVNTYAAYLRLKLQAATTTTTVAPTTTTTVAPTTTTTTTAPAAGPADVVFRDGFEAGSLAAWTSSASNNGKLSVTASAALADSLGLQAVSAGTTPLYVDDATPAALAGYHARFRFSPNGAVISGSGTEDILVGRDARGATLFVVQVRSALGGGYEVRTGGRTANGSTMSSSWAPLTNGPHTIEIGWSAASTSVGKNGQVSLWLDGTFSRSISGLANGSMRLENVRLGLQNLTRSVTGTQYFDNFSSTKGSYIGV
jgi:Subtilase family